ncbi:MAG: Ndufb11, NADH dehydrogenase 1 beta subcomplex subunit [Benniella sp.]|nr:MAG: Ndufb11, NADH dehydrogenase 1 beta subcomplex subunit [Benniella sp.]
MSSTIVRSFTRTPFRKAVQLRRGGGGHEGYNLPTGYLFGEKPLAPGAKRVKEDWEGMYIWGFMGSMAVGTAFLYYKPDTNVHTWAYREAKARLEARGENVEYQPEDKQ